MHEAPKPGMSKLDPQGPLSDLFFITSCCNTPVPYDQDRYHASSEIADGPELDMPAA